MILSILWSAVFEIYIQWYNLFIKDTFVYNNIIDLFTRIIVYVFFNNYFAHYAYALDNPPVPNLIPPKYLIIKTLKFVKFSDSIDDKIGLPAEPLGSLSSEVFSLSIVLIA